MNIFPDLPLSFVIEFLTNPFVLLILALFSASFILLRRYQRQLPAQRRALGIVQGNYDELVKTGETNPEAVSSELLNRVPQGSVVAQRIEELHRIRAHGGDFDQTALAEVTAARESAQTSFAKYCASVLVLLGLCGAIFGLSKMVFRMGPELREMERLASQGATPSGQESGGTAQALSATIQKSVGTLVNTMATSLEQTRGAFFASLSGVLLSVILLFFNWLVSRRQVEFLTALESLTTTRLIPLFKPPRQESELAGVVESFKEGSGYLIRLSNELDNQVIQVGGSLETLFAIVRKFGEGAGAMQTSQARVYQAQQRLLDLTQEFTDLTSRLEMHQTAANQTIDKVLAAVGESNKNLNRAVEEWQKKHEQTLNLIQGSSEQARAEMKQSREESREELKQYRENLLSVINATKDLSRQTFTVIEQQQEEYQERTVELLHSQTRFVQELHESFVVRDTPQQSAEAWRQVAEHLGRLTEQQSHMMHAVNGLASAPQHPTGHSAPMRLPEPRQETTVITPQLEMMMTQFASLVRYSPGIFSALKLLAGLTAFSISILIGVLVLGVIYLLGNGEIVMAVIVVAFVLFSGVVGYVLPKALRLKSASKPQVRQNL